MEYVIPAGLLFITISGLIVVNVKLAKRPTYRSVDKTYVKRESCSIIHKQVDEKLACLPEIKETVTRIETILNGKNLKGGRDA